MNQLCEVSAGTLNQNTGMSTRPATASGRIPGAGTFTNPHSP